jgi:type IV pilus assembly protein PilC
MFVQLGGELPLPTKIIIDTSDFLGGLGGLIIFAAIVGFFIALGQVRKTERGRYITDNILLKMPIVGMLFKKVAVAKFTRTLGTLISSGVPILDGLNITAKTAGNKVIEYAVATVRKGVSEGKTIAEPLSEAIHRCTG